MSDFTSQDLREQLVRIDRAIAETHKLQSESDKFAAECRKMARDYKYSWVFIAGAAMTAAGGLLGAVSFLMRVTGKG